MSDFKNDICVVSLKDWLDYAAGKNKDVFVALPMIQRGSVWKPKQIIDLWDSLLRGMPMGSLMFSDIPAGIDVRRIGGKVMEKTPASGAIGLIDGQQRTLAMLVAWSFETDVEIDRRIWIDFADKPSDEHLFRLRVTTKNQPFGFQKSSPSTKLSLSELREARKPFNDKGYTQDKIFNMAKPYQSKLPLDLRDLVKLWEGNETKWIASTETLLKLNDSEQNSDSLFIKKNIAQLAAALKRMFALKVPLLKINSDFFNPDDAQNNDENIDPPLAILFKRIGTGGTELSNADYAYSIIKHRIPETYTLVETLHSKDDLNVAGLLTATDLVMTAMRLAAAEFQQADGRLITDWESPTKQDFHRLIKIDGFLSKQSGKGFFQIIKSGELDETFKPLNKLLSYNQNSNPHGLPPYSLPLLHRPLVQILLRWIRIVQQRDRSDDACNTNDILEKNREAVLRFIMYWQLCVTNPSKASTIAYKQLSETNLHFPDLAIYHALLDAEVAIPMVSPDIIEKIKRNVAFTDAGLNTIDNEAKSLRGWRRFHISPSSTETEKKVINLYQRWWGNGGYTHPLLLWLQRKNVAGFEGSPVAGRDEDTPYDFDHICPANHWGQWTGVTVGNRLIDFHEANDSGGHWRLGNSIGNVRVWSREKNRSDGADSPRKKLKLSSESGKEEERNNLLLLSAIHANQIEGWEKCSGDDALGKSWNKDRVKAFQYVVEQRAFTLYQSFYDDLKFSMWPEKIDENNHQDSLLT